MIRTYSRGGIGALQAVENYLAMARIRTYLRGGICRMAMLTYKLSMLRFARTYAVASNCPSSNDMAFVSYDSHVPT